ncbi:MAG: 30S ribosomal protein S16 [Burkholderiales bacterium]|nr:30S ribosomal protein S16 [Burkholderiales bacterium]
MVVIRLARGGNKHRPYYSIVATDSRARRDGRFIEKVGFYNPVAPEGVEAVRIDNARVEYWTSVGAQVSPAVKKLLKRA